MTHADAKKLPVGLYEITWKSGGASLAAIGQLQDGARWFAPCNWSASDVAFAGCTAWRMVESVKLVKAAP